MNTKVRYKSYLSAEEKDTYTGYLKENHLAVVAEDNTLRLLNTYDPNQYWLPFMAGATFLVKKIPVPQKQYGNTALINRSNIQSRLERTIKPDRKMIRYDNNYGQITLPFYETRKLSEDDYKALNAEDFPGWERDNSGCIMKIRVRAISVASRNIIHEWCHQNASGKYHFARAWCYFEREKDAAVFKLAFT